MRTHHSRQVESTSRQTAIGGDCGAARQTERSLDAGYDTPAVSAHARQRWSERAPASELDIETAWRRALTVENPDADCDTLRLYAPADVVFRLQGGVITSVWPANYDSLTTAALGECGRCGNLDRFRTPTAACRWCGGHADTIEMSSGVTITHTGGD